MPHDMLSLYCSNLRHFCLLFFLHLSFHKLTQLHLHCGVDPFWGKWSVFWHEAGDRAPFQMLRRAGRSKIALPQVAAAAARGKNIRGQGEDASSECDAFILTMWNVFFIPSAPSQNVAKFMTDRTDLPVSGEKELDLSRCVSITSSELWWSFQAATPPHVFWCSCSPWLLNDRQAPLLTGCGNSLEQVPSHR